MSKRVVTHVIILLGTILLAGAAIAYERGGERERGMRGEGPGQGRIVYGVITQIDARQITIEPQIPALLLERMAERGREIPELPAEIVIPIGDGTEFYLDGGTADIGAFAVGDTVVIARDRGDDGPGAASKIADEQTAWQSIQQRMGQRGMRGDGPGLGPGGGGQGWRGEGQGFGPGGDGPGMGQRGRLRENMRPVFGEITSLSDDAVTIRIEIPDFVQAMMDERGIEPPADMPESVTLALSERTRFAQNSELVDTNPYGIGDYVAVMAGPAREGEAAVWVMSDYASAQARMEEMRERFGEGGPGGPDGPRGPRGRRGGPGGPNGEGPGPAQNQE